MHADLDHREIAQPDRCGAEQKDDQGVAVGDAVEAAGERRLPQAVEFASGRRCGCRSIGRVCAGGRRRLGPDVEPVGQVHQPAPVAVGVHRLQHDLEPDQDRGDGAGRDRPHKVLGVAAHPLGCGPVPWARRVERTGGLEPGKPPGIVLGGWSPGSRSPMAAGAGAVQNVACRQRGRPRRGDPLRPRLEAAARPFGDLPPSA